MSQRLCGFLVVFLLMFNGEIFGQENSHFGLKSLTIHNEIIGRSLKRIMYETYVLSYNPNVKMSYTVFEKVEVIEKDCLTPRIRIALTPVTYTYVKDIGWFCKKEIQLDKITPIPFRFRLGSLDYVNWMEQKPNVRKGQWWIL